MIVSISARDVDAASSFRDVSSNYWASDAIEYVNSVGIVNGFNDGTFKPKDKITRLQAALIIGRATKVSTNNAPRPKFTDIPTTGEAYRYIAALTAKGVFDNTSQFNPNKNLSRAEMAKILVKAFDLTGSSSKTFRDVKKGHWSEPFINTLVAKGITYGVSAQYFGPTDGVSRAQLAVFIKRTLDGELSEEAAAILKLTNAERSKAGIAPLKLSSEAQPVAMLKAKDMAVNGYFDHQSPTYGSPFDMLKQFGVSYSRAGENLFAGSPDASVAISSWMDSPGHKRNMMDSSFTHMGVGYAKGGPYGHYWVQMFLTK